MRSVLIPWLFLVVACTGCFGESGDEGGSEDGIGDGTGGNGMGGGDEPTDSDGDGVVDDEDVCDGHDDRVDNDDDGTPDGCDDTPQGDQEPEPRAPVTWEITIQGNDFMDGSITIQVGDTVRWVHDDGNTPHTVTSEDGQTEEFDSHPDCISFASLGCMTASSDAFEWTFDAIGTTDYVCKVHASMTDTITVLERYDATPP